MNAAGIPFAFACAGQFAFTVTFLRRGVRGPAFPWRPGTAVSAGVSLGLAVAGGNWAAGAFCAGTLILLLGDWWRRKGRRVARAAGAKSLAALAAVVERAREAGSPLPQGARA